KTVNDFVTPVLEPAGDRMHNEAMALGLDCAAALPKERITQIFEEEQQKYDAAHPPKTRRGHRKPFAFAPEHCNDWIIPKETQTALMTRLVDMALPCGREYHAIRPKARLMASRLIGRFCSLGQQQQFLDLRVHARKPKIDWEALCRDVEAREQAALEA